MISTQQGSIRLFRFSGIQVFLHWSWFVVALIEISSRKGVYHSPIWNVAEYLGLFAIVLTHEFGHALATRQTGGKAEEIILWPFGGIAFVNAPQRPGAQLWSVVAGPLVNVVLWPVLWFSVRFLAIAHRGETPPDFLLFLATLFLINKALLAFNILPIYPLDGGQTLRCLLWFGLGRARSLFIAAILGLVAIPLLAAYAIWRTPDNALWFGFLAVFLGQQCWRGFKHAQGLTMLARLPRHTGFACPTCHEAPPGGPLWLCPNCRQRFDPFSTRGVCPHCQTVQGATTCVHCGTAHPIAEWEGAGRPPASPVIDV